LVQVTLFRSIILFVYSQNLKIVWLGICLLLLPQSWKSQSV